jgi:hypothetical protein
MCRSEMQSHFTLRNLGQSCCYAHLQYTQSVRLLNDLDHDFEEMPFPVRARSEDCKALGHFYTWIVYWSLTWAEPPSRTMNTEGAAACSACTYMLRIFCVYIMYA